MLALNQKKFKLSLALIHLFFILLCIIFIIPMISLLSISFSSESDIIDFGYRLIPRSFSIESYNFVFNNPKQIISSYRLTLFVTLAGTFLSMFIMLMCAYALSRKKFILRNVLSLFIFFTMIFNGGLVSSYILVTQYLRLRNTLWILILWGLVNVWYVFVLRTFIQGISESIIESAFIDGASEFKIFASLILPLSKPSIATIGLFMLLQYWNEWMPALLYITKPHLFPLQYLLQRTLQNLEEILRNMDKMPGNAIDYKVPSESVRMAMAVVAAGPMLMVMPFFQKYFVRGMTIGAVKG